ncbi:hypothetical protein ABG067_006375 [Albugo candida]
MSPFSWDSTITDSSINSLEDVRFQSDAGPLKYQSTFNGISTDPSDFSMMKQTSQKIDKRISTASASGNVEEYTRPDKRKSILAYQNERRKGYVEADNRGRDDIPILEERDDELTGVDLVCCEPKQPTANRKQPTGIDLDSEPEAAMSALQRRSIKSGLLYRMKGKGMRIKNSWKLSYTVVNRNAVTFYTRENGKVCGQFDLTVCTSTSIEVMPKDSIFDGSRATLWRASGNVEEYTRPDKRKSILAYQNERRKGYVEADNRGRDDIPILEERDDELTGVDLVCCEPKQPTANRKQPTGIDLDSEPEAAMSALQRRSIKSGLLYRMKGKGMRIKNSWKLSYTVVNRNAVTFYTRENGKVCGQFDLTVCTSTSIEVMPKDSIFDGSRATLWRFAIRSVKDRMVFSANSEADLKEWLRAIHLAIQLNNCAEQRFSDVRAATGSFLATFGRGLFRFSALNGKIRS